MKMKNLLNKRNMDNKKLLLIATASVIAIYLDFMLIIKPQVRSITGTMQKKAQKQQDLKNLMKYSNNLKELEDKQSAEKQKLLLKAKKIIPEEQLPLLLQNLSETANKNDVRVLQIKPFKESPGKSDKGSAVIGAIPLLIKLDLVCGYHNLGRFINNLENAQIFIAVQEMKITAQQTDYFRQKVNLTLRTYVKK